MAIETRSIKRKPPRVERGETWRARSVARLYLEDLVYIYDVLQDYAEHSPFIRDMEAMRQERIKVRESTMQLRKEAGDDYSEFLVPVEPLGPPVKIEADDWIVHTIEDLQSLNLEGIRDLEMSVGITDLNVYVNRFGVRIQTFDDSEAALTASRAIRERVAKRQPLYARIVLSLKWLAVWSVLSLTLIVIAIITDIRWFMIASYVLSTVVFLYLIWAFLIWDRRYVVIPEFKRNVAPPWYASNEMKVGTVLAIVAVVLGWLFGVI